MDGKNFLAPAEIIVAARDIGIQKTQMPIRNQLLAAFLAGVYVAFAAQGSNMVAFDLLMDPTTYGLGRCMAGIIFPAGLVFVLLAGAELFTGNTMLSIPLLAGRISVKKLLAGWIVVYIGNLVGAIFIAWLLAHSGLYGSEANHLGGMTIKIAAGKTNLAFSQAFILGILCNWLVCLAIWMSWGAKDMAGKVLCIFFPIWLFVLSGFEHCVANMYYVPAGIFASANPTWLAASGLSEAALANLTWGGFFLHNLLPVTLGNIVGGGIFVGLFYGLLFRKVLMAKS